MRQKKAPSPWLMLGCAWLLAFSMYAPMLCIPPMEHLIREELLISRAQVGLLFAGPVGMLIAVAIPSGLLADRFGIRKVVGIGAVTMVVGTSMRGIFMEFPALLGFTGLYGIGFSLIYPNLPKLVGSWFPRAKAGLVTGIYTTGIVTAASLALAITLPVVFPLTDSVRGTLCLWSIPAAVGAALWWALAKEPPAMGSGIQSRETKQMNPPSVPFWRTRGIWLVALMLLFNNVHFYIWAAWSPALLIMKGSPPDLAAVIGSVMGWISLPVVFLMPLVSYKVGLRKPFIWISALVLAFLSSSAIFASVPFFWPLMVLVGITTGGTFSMILALPVEMVPKERIGMASGMVLSIGYIGGLVGPWAAGYLVDLTGSYDSVLIVLSGTALLWAGATFLLPETGPAGLSV